ncbi:ADP-ribosylglycohydrolase family protein [Solirubrobacter ginsenosidimutans]|uniref:ADP-ribosylglycohydrolase family protein n=1 Tax=Solirubrobacter ginsenosidimutans TaxID=490573 RepID=A0A9X3RZY7_9ACTN|nr:ADP-ribosylglycohydrolase family protein [Solirubrobacter ginsenosidimutans]MDA0159452.1 ADP-ribosylglycohydrolase family protein [Solirubrobacter ginsenosidimutans]
MTRRDRFRGALLGLAVGDAVGTTVEFATPGTFPPVRDMVGGGPFSLPPGAWTDDTSMALCLAESLVQRRTFDPVDQLQRYVRWYRDGHWSSTGRCFDIGNATRAALERFEQTGEPYPGDAAPDAAGNGPLMKLAPIVLAYASKPAEAIRHAGGSARTTHGAREAADACRAFATLLLAALNGSWPRNVGDPGYDRVVAAALGAPAFAALDPRVTAALRSTREPPAVRGGGYVVDALEAALWALRSTSTFEDGVLAAVNLGDDADTTAAIYGQLAGALYGADGIPESWRERLHRHDEIVAFADALLDQDLTRPALPRFEHIRPRVHAQCASPQDVAEALATARQRGLPIAVRSGGHDFAGRSSTTGVLIDTRPMHDIEIDGTRVTVGAGVRLGELYDALDARGRTVAAGCGPTVGVAGLTLGGGIGILGRLHGFTCDQLEAAQVVLHDGEVVWCDEQRHAELFWGLRGAGGARFGVVTRLVLSTKAAPNATVVHLELPLAQADEALHLWQQLDDAPDELAASLLVVGGGVHIFGAHVGTKAEAAHLLAPFKGHPQLDELPYRDVKRRLAATGPGDGEDLPFHRSGFFANPLEVLPNAHGLEFDFSPLGGAYNRKAPDATAFPHRDARFLLKVAGRDQATVDAAFPSDEGTGGVYPNFPEPDRDPWDPAYHLGNHQRLQELRAKYDPHGVF